MSYKVSPDEMLHVIVVGLDGSTGLKCIQSRLTSWNPNNVKSRWCDACKAIVKTYGKPVGELQMSNEKEDY